MISVTVSRASGCAAISGSGGERLQDMRGRSRRRSAGRHRRAHPIRRRPAGPAPQGRCCSARARRCGHGPIRAAPRRRSRRARRSRAACHAATRCAAAARPTGPAPITATGSSAMRVIDHSFAPSGNFELSIAKKIQAGVCSPPAPTPEGSPHQRSIRRRDSRSAHPCWDSCARQIRVVACRSCVTRPVSISR